LSSLAAPGTAMLSLELDGYLTGIVVTPQSARSCRARGLRGYGAMTKPIFDNNEQITTVLGAMILIRPFVGFFDLGEHEPDDPGNIDEILYEDAALIHRMILVLRKLARDPGR